MNEYTLIVQDSNGKWQEYAQSPWKDVLSQWMHAMISKGKYRTDVAIVKTENLSHYIEQGE